MTGDHVAEAQATKEALLDAAREMLRCGLVEGTAGNVAARLPDGNVVLTPSSLDYARMTVDDLVVCDLDGNVLEGAHPPTTEKALHLETLRRHRELGATMHCHGKHATGFAVAREPIPAVVEEFAVYVGGDVNVAEYRPTGSHALAVEVAAHVERKAAVLMANHGLFTVGTQPAGALHVARLVERTAEIVLSAQALGRVVPLPEGVREEFAAYYRLGRGGS